MTEIPEHLLRRSRERRAALGLGGGESPAPPAGEEAPAADAAQAAPAAATPAPVEPSAPPAEPPPPPPVPAHVAAAVRRPKIPVWAVPVLAALPLWAIVYAGSLSVPEGGITDPILAEGQEIYASQCSGCHGGEGQGGTGRPLDGGSVIQTFPDPADHIAWVTDGSPEPGTPYGNPDRPGGQHISQDEWGAMPGFGEDLTEEEILAVVRYEREIIGGETESALADAPTAEAETEGGDEGAADQSSGE